MTYNGGSNFAIFLLDDTGQKIDLLVNTIGGFNGAKAVGIRRAGAYLLDVTATGVWSVSVEQPLIGESAPSAPQTFSGDGQSVSPKVALKQGLVTFHMTHNGRSNFAVFLYDDKGNRIDLLANTIGNFDGSKPVRINSSGAYLLDITADGHWTIGVEQ
ncbi:MAG: hypothetical protein LC737_11245 [Chloroflexi bacterium]|nr:hypothetical protein [Chloroflexota bacterium]